MGQFLYWDSFCTGTVFVLGQFLYWDSFCTGTVFVQGQYWFLTVMYQDSIGTGTVLEVGQLHNGQFLKGQYYYGKDSDVFGTVLWRTVILWDSFCLDNRLGTVQCRTEVIWTVLCVYQKIGVDKKK